MQPVSIMQCGICKVFHLETAGPCPDCQAHPIHQLVADGDNYPAALRQAAQLLRRKADEMEREAAALEAAAARAVSANSESADPGDGVLTRRTA